MDRVRGVPEGPSDAGVAARVPYEAYRGVWRFGSLDGLRALSILAVIWHHTAAEASMPWMFKRGFLGVDVFFVLSGYLIVTLLLRERERAGRISLRAFYARRALRIFPPYYALLAVVGALLGVMASPSLGLYLDRLPYYALYLSNWVVEHALFLAILWSLAAEEQFYLIWPPIERWLPRLALPILGVVILANQAVNFRLTDGLTERWFGVKHADLPMLQATFTPICLGVLLAHALHDRRVFGRVWRLAGRRWSAPVALAVMVAAWNIPGEDIAGLPRLVFQASVAWLLCCCVVREDNGLAWALGWSVAARVGLVSYGMYLFHMLVADATNRGLERIGSGPGPILFVSTVVLTWCVSELSYRYYEKPFLRLKPRKAAPGGLRREGPA